MALSDTTRLARAVPDLLAWYAANERPLPWRTDRSAYHTWISEIMLQQTRIEAVIGYYHRFLERFPTIPDIARCDDDALMKAWEGLGYYSRARHIKEAAVIMTDRYGGDLPHTKAELQALPGIGPYTAAAIASISYGEPAAAVDGNVLRVTARLLDDERDVLQAKTRTAMTALLNDVIPADAPGAFNEAMMELGETVCLPAETPDCARCPLRGACLARERGTVADRPVRNAKVSKKSEKMTVFVIIDPEGRVAIRQRPKTGLLSGLYEFPHVPGHLSAEKARACLQDGHALFLPDEENDRPPRLNIGRIERLPDHTHVFTHKKWLMQAYLVHLASPAPASGSTKKKDEHLRFVPPDQLYDIYPIPTAFAFCRDAIGGTRTAPVL